MAIIGVDLGGTNVDIGIVSNDGEVIKTATLPTIVKEGPEKCIKRIVDKIKDIIKQSETSIEDIVGIGVGSPGPMDIAKGAMKESPNFPEKWIDYSIKDDLSSQLDLPVEIDNDANAACLGELWVGGGKGIDDFLVLTLGTGIGGGIITNGKIVRGADNYGGELGHVGVYPDGRECGCGKKGCLEAYASATAMIKRAKELIKFSDYQKSSSQLEQGEEDKIDAMLIFNSARSGDKLADKIVKEAGDALGLGIGTLMNIFNPRKIILAGRMAQSFDLIYPYIKANFEKHAFDSMVENVSVESSILGNNAGLIGAAAVFVYEREMISKTPFIYPDPQPYTIAAINVGASGMRIAIVDINEESRSYKIINQKHVSGRQPNEDAIWKEIIKAYKYVLSNSSKHISDLKAISVTSPGPIDRKRKQVLNTPNVNWSFVTVEEKLYHKINKSKGLKIPLFLERDAIAITLAEQYFGYGRDLENYAVIYIGTGIGAGFVFNGEIFYGVHDHAGEFGHGIIDRNSTQQCRCRNFGCLECFASGQSLILHCIFDIKRGETSSLSSKIGDLYYNDILEEANKGDTVAVNAFKEMGKALGIGLSNLINYLDLEKIIISGPLSRGSKHYLNIVREITTKNIIFSEVDKEWSRNNIVATELGYEDIEIAGAVAAFINQQSKSQ